MSLATSCVACVKLDQYLFQSVCSVASRQHLRSASRGLLVVPRHYLSSYGRRAFSVAALPQTRFYFQLTRYITH